MHFDFDWKEKKRKRGGESASDVGYSARGFPSPQAFGFASQKKEGNTGGGNLRVISVSAQEDAPVDMHFGAAWTHMQRRTKQGLFIHPVPIPPHSRHPKYTHHPP